MKKKNLILIIILVAVVLIGIVAYYYKDVLSSLTTGETQSETESSVMSVAETDGTSADTETGTDATEAASDAKTGADNNQTSDGSEGVTDRGESKTDTADSADQDASAEDKKLTPAPDFTVYDADGNEIHLSDYVGRPVVLNFWASWCGPCKMEMPDFDERYEALNDDVQFMMVNLTDGQNETVKTASEFIKGQGYTFPVFFDQDGNAAQTYGIYSIPTTFFIDDAGNVVAQATGAISADVLQRGIDMIYQVGE